jgi:predicted RNA-binding Zn-ribbon protein involved in translation (DUF1610 family)
MKKENKECPECTGEFYIEHEETVMFCPFCGEEIIDEEASDDISDEEWDE